MNATRLFLSAGSLSVALSLPLTGCDLPVEDDSDSGPSATSNVSTTGVDSSSDTALSTTTETTSSGDETHGTCDEGSGSSSSGGSTGMSDLPPVVAITAPAMDLLGDEGPVYDGYDDALGLYYADVELTASAADPEDGDLSSSITWATDGTAVQDAALGTGGALTTRLYSNDCFGFLHTVSASVTDSDGNETIAQRRIFIWTLC